MSGPRRTLLSSRALSGAPAGSATRRPPLDCRSRMDTPSYADHGSLRRSPCRCPVHNAKTSASLISADATDSIPAMSCSLQTLSLRSATYRRPPLSQGFPDIGTQTFSYVCHEHRYLQQPKQLIIGASVTNLQNKRWGGAGTELGVHAAELAHHRAARYRLWTAVPSCSCIPTPLLAVRNRTPRLP